MRRVLIVEADGGSRGNPGPAAFGSVVKDADSGQVLVERAEALGTVTNNVAEYRGVIAGLEEAHRIDPGAAIEVRLDSKLIVEQMSGRWKIKHPDMRALALQARDIHDTSLIRWTWVPRAQNSHADRLLNEVLDGDRGEPARRPLMRPPSLGEPTTLLLLRHGETPLTVERRFSGRGGRDVGLTEDGRRQVSRAATVLAERLDGTAVAAIVASPLLRTVQTAEIVAERLGTTVQPDDDLAEMAFGEWDGLTFPEARSADPDFFDRWISDPRVVPPGGESLAAVAARTESARRRLVEQFDEETVVLASHAMPIKTIVAAAVEAPLEAAHRVDITPASVAEVAYWADGHASLRSLGL